MRAYHYENLLAQVTGNLYIGNLIKNAAITKIIIIEISFDFNSKDVNNDKNVKLC